jgi:hypothetical protein
MSTANKRYSYPRVIAIQIDVHPIGETPIHTTRMLSTPVHVCPAYAYYRQTLYVATFRESSIDFDRSHCSREKGLPKQSTARQLTDSWVRTQFLSQTNQ